MNSMNEQYCEFRKSKTNPSNPIYKSKRLKIRQLNRDEITIRLVNGEVLRRKKSEKIRGNTDC